MRTRIPARDLEIGQTIYVCALCHNTPGPWVEIGHIQKEWGVVWTWDTKGSVIARFPHGHPVLVKETQKGGSES